MNTLHRNKTLFAISWIIASLLVFASGFSLLTPSVYFKESQNWLVQSIGQDVINLLLITPVLIFTSILAYRGNKKAVLVWAGAIFYLIYTYVIYCFDIHFNSLFVVYCLILGFSFYSFIYFLLAQVQKPIINTITNTIIIRITGIYLIAVSSVFYLLWLWTILPAIVHNSIPNDLVEAGLITNPVHVIDLSVCLPGLFIAGLMVLRKKSLGLILAPAMLMFCILMNITIGSLVIFMKINDLTEDSSIAFVMGILALFSIGLLVFYLRNIEKLPKNTLTKQGSEILSPSFDKT